MMISASPTLCRPGLAPAPNIPNPRNAGRKKSNPVWEFFTDLRSHGLAGVRCRFCHWVTNDRSPTTMKFHLKRKHDTGAGGLWAICEEKINSQAPANYAPRSKKMSDDLFLKALSQQNFAFNPFATAEVKLGAQDDFLNSLIQQATQYASSSPSSEALNNHENEAMALSDSIFLGKLTSESTPKEEDSSSSSVSGIAAPNEFQLSDGTSIAALLQHFLNEPIQQIATDSDLTFTFNARRIGEYCFESNKKNGKMVTLCDCGNEIRVVQRESDEEIRVEMWRKSDWLQFTWAVRGTCLHFLKAAQ